MVGSLEFIIRLAMILTSYLTLCVVFDQNIFSVVSATFDSESLEWLPPQCELQNFVKHLCGVEIKVSEEDGNILAWGNLEDIVNIKVQVYYKFLFAIV